MRILATMKRFPAGVMVIPLLLGCAMNTFFPNALTIGGFTSGLFKNGVPTLIGLFLFCSGATIDVKMAGSTVWKGVVLTALKFFIGFGLGLLLNALFGEAGFLGLAPLAVIGAVTNSNGVIYATLAGEFGDETDVGATSILALNDGPFFTMIALGASGMGNFPITDIIASIIPMVIGFIIGNLDHEWRKILATGMILLPPFNGFALGAGMNFNNILRAGISGIVLGLLTVLATGLLTFFLYSASAEGGSHGRCHRNHGRGGHHHAHCRSHGRSFLPASGGNSHCPDSCRRSNHSRALPAAGILAVQGIPQME